MLGIVLMLSCHTNHVVQWNVKSDSEKLRFLAQACIKTYLLPATAEFECAIVLFSICPVHVVYSTKEVRSETDFVS